MATTDDEIDSLALAIERLWAVPLRDTVRDAGELVLAQRSVTMEDLVVLGMELGDALDTEADD